MGMLLMPCAVGDSKRSLSEIGYSFRLTNRFGGFFTSKNMPLIRRLIDASKGKHPLGAARSGHWPMVRKQHLETHPVCEVCGGSVLLEVHHIHPFHLHPALELEPSNLVTLCEAKKDGVNCHLLFGHLGNFKSFNTEVLTDAPHWAKKISERPLAESTINDQG